MRPQATWTAFLLMCFALVGLTGMFASYAVSIPLDRTLARTAVLDGVLAEGRQPDPARQATLRMMLGPEVGPRVLDGPGELFDRVAAQREIVLQEGAQEERSVVHRIRVLVAVVTVMAGVVGSGIMGLARRAPAGTA
ncbi:MAG: hypothetical protein ACRYHQ_09810 [Janthinobacterium lividum]